MGAVFEVAGVKALFAGIALAAVLAVWGLRGTASNEFAHPDAPRHALNGVMIHDWITEAHLKSPIQFARQFYSHLPGTSIPYHPPLYPAFESLFYLAAGVNRFSARLATAVCTFLAALLLYRLVRATHGSAAFAALCAGVTFLVPEFQRDASDVMLEMPSLVWVLGALWFVRQAEGITLRDAAAFGLLAAAAVWTKQQAVFLAAIPLVMLALAGQWRAMRHNRVWLGVGLVVAAAAALAGVTTVIGTGDNRQWEPFHLSMPAEHLASYAIGIAKENELLPALIAGITLLTLTVNAIRGGEPRRNHLYLAWAISSIGLVLAMPPIVERYLFFTYPPLVVLACDAARRLLPESPAPWPRTLAATGAVLVALGWLRPAEYVRGPGRAADLVMQDHPARILYCGFTNGDFLFAVRERDPSGKTVVIRGDKLPRETFAPQEMEAFARAYGAEYVVVERIHLDRPWIRLASDPAPSMQWVASFPITSSMPFENGELRVYRFLNPSPTPKNTLQVRSDLVKHGLEVSF